MKFDLHSILESVAKGDTSVDKAAQAIQKNYETKKKSKKAFERIKKTTHIDDLLKIPTQIVNQFSENISNIEKIQENFIQNLNAIGFSSNNQGIDSKLSVFRAFEISKDSVVSNNQIVGSQWFRVIFSENSEVKNNKFTAVQFSDLSIVRSDFCSSKLGLTRLSHFTLQESCFKSNRFSRATLSDVSLTESDFTENSVVKCDFSATVINSSRLNKMSFNGVDFQDCEFDSCDIQGIEFENCKFKECCFQDSQLLSPNPSKISNCVVSGKNITGCRTIEDFLTILNEKDS